MCVTTQAAPETRDWREPLTRPAWNQNQNQSESAIDPGRHHKLGPAPPSPDNGTRKEMTHSAANHVAIHLVLSCGPEAVENLPSDQSDWVDPLNHCGPKPLLRS